MNNVIELIADKIESMTYVGIGYVIIPSDVNRDEYIQHCYLNESVSIYPDTGGISYNDVKVSQNCLNYIEFPEKERLGSCVVYILHPTKKRPIIVSVLSKNDESLTLNYKLFKLTKSLKGNGVTITGDGSNGNLMINLDSEENEGGQIIINVNHSSGNGSVKLNVKGNIAIISKNLNLNLSENVNIKAKEAILETDKTTIKAKEFITEGDKIKVKHKEVELGDKNLEAVVLGDTLKNDILVPLLSTLQTFSVIVSSFGPTVAISPATLSQLKLIETKINKLLSKKVKVE